MSPWRMMNEWGIPTVYIECLLYKYLKRLKEKGEFIPSIAIAGGIVLEDQIFKAIALGAPYVQAICMGRSTLTAGMVGKSQGQHIEEAFGKGKEYEDALLRTFAGTAALKEKYGKDFVRIPPAAIGIYSYYDRLAVGLQQLMAGARKFALNLIERDDLMALTREAADISGISYLMDADSKEVENILG
jgi:glutamate synthase domain-containing protein 2